MKRRSMIIFALFLALGLIAAACGGGGQADSDYPPEMVSEGGNLYQGTCSACHGEDAKGLPNLGKDLMTSEFVQNQSDEELVAFIKQGRPVSDPENTTGVDMPPKGGNPALNDEDLMAIVAYLRTIHE